MQFNVTKYSEYLRDLNQQLNKTTEKLNDTIQARAAVPTSQVYVSMKLLFAIIIKQTFVECSILSVTITQQFVRFYHKLMMNFFLQPLFTKVTSIWTAFQSEVVYLTILRRLLDSLSLFTQVSILTNN